MRMLSLSEAKMKLSELIKEIRVGLRALQGKSKLYTLQELLNS
jgi:hypothetical protein